jgi:DNA-damage-inducible protein J
MRNQVNLNIRIDSDIKEVAESLFDKMGLSMTAAINTFIRQAIREQALPFEVKPLDNYDLKIKKSLKEADEKRLISFDLDELRELENKNLDEALFILDSKKEFV